MLHRGKRAAGLAGLVTLLAAAPATAQRASCNPVIQPLCRLGGYRVETDFDVFSPLVSGAHSWSIELFDDRIDLRFRMPTPVVTPAPPLGDVIFPFFEYRLYYTLFPPSPTRFFEAAVLTTASGYFDIPSSGSWASFGTGLQVSRGDLGAMAGSACPRVEGLGVQSCYLVDHRTGLPFGGPSRGAVFGYLDVTAFFSNPGPGTMAAEFADLDIRGSIYFDQVTPVPEPATVGLLALGLAGLGAASWLRRRRSFR